MTEGSGARVRGALRVVICWQNRPNPRLMMSRRSFRFEGSLIGPASRHTAFGEQAPLASASEKRETAAQTEAQRGAQSRAQRERTALARDRIGGRSIAREPGLAAQPAW